MSLARVNLIHCDINTGFYHAPYTTAQLGNTVAEFTVLLAKR